MQIGGQQEQVRQDPGGGRGKAGGGEAKYRHQERQSAPGGHLKEPRQGGQRREAHPLDHKPDNVYQGQREIEQRAGQQILPRQRQQRRALLVQEQHVQRLGKGPEHRQRDPGVEGPQQRAGAHALVQPVPLLCPHVLPAVGGHGAAHGVKGTAEKDGHLAGRCDRCDIDGPQPVDGGLHHHAANGGDGVLQPHGQTHDAQLLQPRPLTAPVLPRHAQHRVAPDHPHQAPRPRQQLGQDRGQGRAEHVQMERQNKQDVQRNVDQRRRDLPDDRRAAVPQGAQDAGGEVVEEVGGQSGKNGGDIGVGAGIDVRRSMHPRQDGAAQAHSGRRQDSADARAQPHAVGHIAPQLLLVACAELLGHRDGKAAAHAHTESHHQEVDGAGGAHSRQRRAAQRLAHNSGVNHVVELLEQVSEQHRDAKAENQPHRAAPCQIFRHNDITSSFIIQHVSILSPAPAASGNSADYSHFPLKRKCQFG